MPALENKILIITGASSGIGAAAARLFAREGASLVLGARRGGVLADLVEEIAAEGGEAVHLAGDVAEEGYAAELVALAQDRFGGLDGAFNNAGQLGAAAPVESQTLTEWRRVLEVNLTSAFLAAQAQMPALRARGGGSLVFTSSFVGVTVGMPGMAAYGASKAGMLGLMRVLAVEGGADKIRVNALLPGGTDTPMADAFGSDPETLAYVRNLFALKRIADPDEIARAALFLLSDASSFCTGSELFADGGVSINRA